MNVTFHTLGSIATATVLSKFSQKDSWNFPQLLIGFMAGILTHGILDFLPHNYPIQAKSDVIISLILVAVTLFLTQKRHRFLILLCFGGAIFPDVVDLGGEIANKHLGIRIPHLSFKIFPWHWKEFSGSIYDRTREFESDLYHSVFTIICFGLIYAYQKHFFQYRNNS